MCLLMLVSVFGNCKGRKLRKGAVSVILLLTFEFTHSSNFFIKNDIEQYREPFQNQTFAAMNHKLPNSKV